MSAETKTIRYLAENCRVRPWGFKMSSNGMSVSRRWDVMQGWLELRVDNSWVSGNDGEPQTIQDHSNVKRKLC